MSHIFPAVIAAAIAVLAAGPAAAAVGEWVDGDVVEMRLVAAVDAEGRPAAALEVRLDPGWKTYWRMPGEGGLPTLFDFSQSRNLTEAVPAYPAPHRFNDGWSVTNVYEGRVLFPIALTPTLPTVPATLHVAVDLGVCETICIPMNLDAMVTLVPGEADAEAAAIIAEAQAGLPQPPVAGAFEVAAVTIVTAAAAELTMEAEVIVPQAFGTELFVEGPDGWFATAPYETAREGNRLTFTFSIERPEADTATAGRALTFTLVSAGNAIEQRIVLP